MRCIVVVASLAMTCGCSKPVSPPEATTATPSRAAASSWFGEHEYRSSDGNGSVSIVVKDGRTEVTLEVARADGCTGSVGGGLEIRGARARLTPPLFVVDGSTRHEGTDPCDLEFGLRDNGTIDVTEGRCTAYQGIACGFAGDYPAVKR